VLNARHPCPHLRVLTGFLFPDLFPLKLTSILWRPWNSGDDLSDLLKRFEDSSLGIMDPFKMVKRAVTETSLPVKVTEIVPRLKDGGAFVKFSHDNQITAKDIEKNFSKKLQTEPIKPWFNPFRGIRAGLVKGVPWLEDLYRFPKQRLRVEFVPVDPGSGEPIEQSQETLYSLFRRYGAIGDITSQPSDSKVLPKYALVDFMTVRDAIMSKNCMHGFVVGEELGGGKAGTKLRLSYEKRIRAHRIWDWVSNHPRIVIPLIAALIAGISVVIFDPIREFFIKVHVQHSWSLTDSRLYKWFKRQTSDLMAFNRNKKSELAGLNAVWSHRKDVIEGVQTWLLESTETFIVVQGPRGSGKKELILDQALKDRRDVLVIDCKPVVEARGDTATIKKLANEVGFRPVFSWANSVSSMVDLAVQSTTGVKAGFSETLDSQLAKVLQTTASALQQISLEGKTKKGEKDANLSDDAYLEAHPERRAVVVIDNFLHKNEESSIVYDKIAEWAAALVQSNVAHVIFLTNDTSYSKSLSKSLPDRVFRQVALGDLSPEVAKNYVLSHLDEDTSEELQEKAQEPQSVDSQGRETEADTEKSKNESAAPDGADHGASVAHGETGLLAGDGQISALAEKIGFKTPEKPQAHPLPSQRSDLSELDQCIDKLGGRLADLEFLARRLKSGQSPNHAVNEIIEQSASEILKMFLLAKGSSGTETKNWSTEQAWYLIKEIANKESLRYNEVLLANTFSSSTNTNAGDAEAAIESLANAELITVKSYKGRPQTIRAGKPVYQSAFRVLLDDQVLKAKMDLAILTELANIEAKNISKVETELTLLAGLGGSKHPYQTTERTNYLLKKLEGSQLAIEQLEKEMGTLKKLLTQEA
jgi:hypothetical protein